MLPFYPEESSTVLRKRTLRSSAPKIAFVIHAALQYRPEKTQYTGRLRAMEKADMVLNDEHHWTVKDLYITWYRKLAREIWMSQRFVNGSDFMHYPKLHSLSGSPVPVFTETAPSAPVTIQIWWIQYRIRPRKSSAPEEFDRLILPAW
jgi:hypothetical protein